ncbi:hypothetical protein BT96DRAFT_995257 [Gymnopus androsaceus JB14]|uniref:Uncharacterized protein n=1 Tax=Gymnopus androsaceus JB14 TaxID=1447944 RepID=A0A6A4HJ02_9AGAR|nr:hypothetical protein BT96DRAFT_995257 [Gymnopus androsaceus JB14]
MTTTTIEFKAENELAEVEAILTGAQEEFADTSWDKVTNQWTLGWEEAREKNNWENCTGLPTQILRDVCMDLTSTLANHDDCDGCNTSLDHLDNATWASVQMFCCSETAQDSYNIGPTFTRNQVIARAADVERTGMEKSNHIRCLYNLMDRLSTKITLLMDIRSVLV